MKNLFLSISRKIVFSIDNFDIVLHGNEKTYSPPFEWTFSFFYRFSSILTISSSTDSVDSPLIYKLKGTLSIHIPSTGVTRDTRGKLAGTKRQKCLCIGLSPDLTPGAWYLNRYNVCSKEIHFLSYSNIRWNVLPSDGVDRDIGGESGHLLKMFFLTLESF